MPPRYETEYVYLREYVESGTVLCLRNKYRAAVVMCGGREIRMMATWAEK